jgi:4'-phosphopantetheinyl transferase
MATLKVLLQDLDRLPPDSMRHLSEEERSEAAWLLGHEDARHKAAARAWLRQELGTVLGMRPDQVHVRRQASGKPEVAGPLAFNLSHSGRWAAIALLEHPEALGCMGVGVDLETLSQATGLWAARDQFLHPSEHLALAHQAPEQRDHMSLLCWTRKEAVLKALGVGLLAPDLTPGRLEVGTLLTQHHVRPPSDRPGSWPSCEVVSYRTQDVMLSVAWQGTAPLQVAWP